MLYQLVLALAALASAGRQSSPHGSYAATFTVYGVGDANGSGDCNKAGACGTKFAPESYSAAVSQSLFGVGPNQGAGPACGKCYRITIGTRRQTPSQSVMSVQADSSACVENDATSGKRLPNAGNSLVIKVKDLCPRKSHISHPAHSIIPDMASAGGNGVCGQRTLSDKNQYGAMVNFDLCKNSGAADAFFGNTGIGLATGHAEEVDCSAWRGRVLSTAPWARGHP
ncbi:putative endoglucanase v-like protein [Teratosphaeria destructans]|uniref:Endoglucanase v-like protein n=1 Tax=Teratosphaeria destructans TaxID=418781 RepID=A0A9W7SSD5_9PEZI|nr:putative endoglucanase v-like protein [Teratosphaeria destructans]